MENEIVINETSKMTSQTQPSTHTGLGQLLKDARKAMHLTQKEAAARLYLNPKIVEVIEEEAFFEGPPMTFMRGYIRSYAKLLNVSDNDIKAAIDALELTAAPSTPTAPVLQTNPTYRGDRYIRWITYLIVLTLASFVILWWTSYSKNNTEATPVVTQTAATMTTEPSTIPTPAAQVENTPTSPTASTEKPIVEAQPVTPPITSPTTVDKPVTATPAPAIPSAALPSNPAAPTENTAPPIATGDASVPSQNSAPSEPEKVAPPPTNTNDLIPPTMPSNVSSMVAPPEEKPVHKTKKKYRRHQYRPIENMDIPEPE